jgi:hypothetical protein
VKVQNLFIEVVLVSETKRNGHSCRAMVINNELENFAGKEMQTYSAVNCIIDKVIKKKISRPFLRFFISYYYQFEIVFSI